MNKNYYTLSSVFFSLCFLVAWCDLDRTVFPRCGTAHAVSPAIIALEELVRLIPRPALIGELVTAGQRVLARISQVDPHRSACYW